MMAALAVAALLLLLESAAVARERAARLRAERDLRAAVRQLQANAAIARLQAANMANDIRDIRRTLAATPMAFGGFSEN